MHNVSMWINFQSIPLYIVYNFQHFESIEYVNGILRSFHAFWMNDPKLIKDLDEFMSFLESMMWQCHV
jgi:hypothetical protein